MSFHTHICFVCCNVSAKLLQIYLGFYLQNNEGNDDQTIATQEDDRTIESLHVDIIGQEFWTKHNHLLTWGTVNTKTIDLDHHNTSRCQYDIYDTDWQPMTLQRSIRESWIIWREAILLTFTSPINSCFVTQYFHLKWFSILVCCLDTSLFLFRKIVNHWQGY